MNTHLKTIAALIVIFGILACLCYYATLHNPLIGFIIFPSICCAICYAIVYKIIKDNE